MLSIGILGQSSMENEFRLPIHPSHFQRIPADVSAHLFIETGYGDKFDVSDDELAPHLGGVLGRRELIVSIWSFEHRHYCR